MKPKNRNLFVVALLIAIVFAFVGYPRRLQIAARFWHWRHGDITYVGGYEVPVPKDWLPEMYDDPSIIDLVHTRPSVSDGPLSKTGIIFVTVVPLPLKNTLGWESATRRLFENYGVQDVQEISMEVAHEEILCIGGHVLSHLVPHSGITAVSFQCVSSGHIGLQYSGPESDLDQFRAIASGIRQRE
jgi:hypothetical protein